ncbi:aldehyde dehydrogenase family protein, partial [uncultured Limosilactobacillus sp.]
MTSLNQIGQQAKTAAHKLALLDTTTKNHGLQSMANALIANQATILEANKQDLANASEMPKKFVDRLMLNEQRITDMANGLRSIAQLPDPTAQIDRGWISDDGLQIIQRRVPLGVIGIIFEARPNVTADATGLTFKSGNAVILRGGKEALQTNLAIAKTLREALVQDNLPADAVQMVADPSHESAQ